MPDELYFVVLRKINDPSVNYKVEHFDEKVFVVPESVVIEYYEAMMGYGASTLIGEAIPREYVERHLDEFRVLEK